MASDRSASRPSWRPAGTPSPRRRQSDPNWRRAESSPSEAPARRWRWPRIVLGLAVASACYALGVWAVLWLRPLRPAGVYVVQAGYLENLAIPPNALGLNSASALAALPTVPKGWHWTRSGLGRVARPVDLGAATAWNKGLGELSESTVIIYLTGQGGGDGRGAFIFRDAPGILGREEDQVNSSGKLHLASVVADLAKVASKRFLVILDVGEAASNPALGMLRNDFGGHLADLRGALAQAGNVVVLAAGPAGRRAGAAPPWRERAFGHLVVEGLAGAAAGPGGRIDAGSLAGYIAAKSGEAPILLPRGRGASRLDLALAPEPRPAAKVAAAGPAPAGWKDDRAARWKAHDALDRLAPASFAPHLWRRYRETLLRYDDLARSAAPDAPATPGSPASARDRLATRLDAMDVELRDARRLALASAGSTLAMPAAEGPDPEPSKGRKAGFDAYRLGGGAAPGGPDRAAFHDLLLRDVGSARGPADLDRAADVLDRLRAAGAARPAEAHFLALLLRDRPPGLADSPAGLAAVADAVKARLLAERVALGLPEVEKADPAAYSLAEQAAPMVAALVAGGDRARRPAEDLLLVTDPARRASAVAGLAEALGKYGEAAAQAGRARQALAARDRAFADLPYYSDWAARRADVTPPPRGRATSRALVDRIEAAWDDAHELASALGPAPPSDDASARAGRLAEALDWAGAEFRAEGLELLGRGPARGDRETIVAELDTPFPDADRREKILGRLAKADPASPAPPTDREATLAAVRAGRLALAALGRRWVDDPDYARRAAWPGPGPAPSASDRPASFDEIRKSLGDREVSSAPAGDEIARVGDRIGRARRLLAEAVQDRARRGLSAPLKDWPAGLQEADRIGRTLLGAQYAVPDEPTAIYRRRLVQRLLLAQAGRALDDHYFNQDDRPPAAPGEPEPAPPYYRAQVAGYLGDLARVAADQARDAARDLASADDGAAGGDEGAAPARSRAASEAYLAELRRVVADQGRDPERMLVEAEAAAPGRLAVTGRAGPLVVTDEPGAGLRYGLLSPAGSRGSEGRAAVWIEADAGGPVRVDEPAPGSRRDVAIDRDRAASPPRTADDEWPPLRLGFPPVEREALAPGSTPAPGVIRGGFRLAGRYRGQVLLDPSEVAIHPVPEILVTRAAPPPTGEVALRADPALLARHGGVDAGALAIVLDCSGSMGADGDDPPPDAPSKYREATAALRQVLRRVTRGTRVSLWVFGEAMGPEKAVRPAERTIRAVLAPTPWRPDDPALLADVLARVEPPTLLPWNESPIVDAMIRAIGDLRGERGFKSMLVLTDGKDDSFDRKPAPPNRPRPEIGAALLAAFRDTGIEVNIVGYKVANVEDEIRRQFRAIETMRPPGHFYSADQADALADELAKALRPQLRYSVQSRGNVAVTDAVELGDDESSTPGFRELPPGPYRLVVETAARSQRDLTINQGDRLIVRLSADGRGGVAMNRLTWTETLLPRPPLAEAAAWRLSALKSQARPGGGLALWAALESRPNPAETSLELIRAREVWLEARADDAAAPSPSFQQRWGRIDSLPAPAWELSVPAAWPAGPTPNRPARPRVEAFWDPGNEAPAIASLGRAEIRSVRAGRPLTLATRPGPVAIESVRLEPIDANGGGSLRRLIVRASYPKAERFWVRPVGLQPGRVEHRFYTEAGRYTGVFWPVNEDQVGTLLDRLELVSVTAFRDQARALGFSAEVKADIPAAGDAGPILDPSPEAGPIAPAPLPAARPR